MYGKLLNGVLEYAPDVYTVEHTVEIEHVDEEGNITIENKIETLEIVNFNNNIELMKKYGFKEVVDIKPEHTKKQIAKVIGYEENDTQITVNYEVVDRELTLEERFTNYINIQNRRQLSATYSADKITFKVDTNYLNEEQVLSEVDMDLFTLIRDVIIVGKDNYNRVEVETMMDFYITIGKINWDLWDELWFIIESQHGNLLANTSE